MMLRFVAVVALVAAVWGLSLALPSTDEQGQLMTVLGISAKGDPDAFRKSGVAKGVIPVIFADEPAASPEGTSLAVASNVAVLSARHSLSDGGKIRTVDAITAEVTLSKSTGSDLPGNELETIASKALKPAAGDENVVVSSDDANQVKVEVARLDEEQRSGEVRDLTIRLQQQLRRVGCYGGKINGLWSTGTRSAMAKFNSRIEAELPINEPDYVLLTLVEKYEDRACGIACEKGQIPNERGICVAKASPGDDSTPVIEAAAPSQKVAKIAPREVFATIVDAALPAADDEQEATSKIATASIPEVVEPQVPNSAVEDVSAGKAAVERPIVRNLVVDELVSEPVEVARLDAAEAVADASGQAAEQPANDPSANEFAVVIPSSVLKADEVRILASSKPRKLAVRKPSKLERAKQSLSHSFRVADIDVVSEPQAVVIDRPVQKKRRIVELSQAFDQPVVRKATVRARPLRVFNAPRFSLGVRPARIQQRAKVRTFRIERVVAKRRFVTRFRKRMPDWKVRVFMPQR